MATIDERWKVICYAIQQTQNGFIAQVNPKKLHELIKTTDIAQVRNDLKTIKYLFKDWANNGLIFYDKVHFVGETLFYLATLLKGQKEYTRNNTSIHNPQGRTVTDMYGNYDSNLTMLNGTKTDFRHAAKVIQEWLDNNPVRDYQVDYLLSLMGSMNKELKNGSI